MVRRTLPVKIPDKSKPIKKKRSRRKQASSQIKKLRKSTAPILPLSFFARAFKAQAPSLRIQNSALKAIRESVEREAHGLFESALAVMESSKKNSLTQRHLQAANNIPLLRMGNA